MEARGLGEVEQAFDAATADEGVDALFGFGDPALAGTTRRGSSAFSS